MRDELSALYQLLHALSTRGGLDLEASQELIARACSGLEATLDAHLQRIVQLEARCGDLADELVDVQVHLDRLNDRCDHLVDDVDEVLSRLEALQRMCDTYLGYYVTPRSQ